MPQISLQSEDGIGTIGVPTDGDYSTGICGLTPDTTVADAVDTIDELLAILVNQLNPQPGNLIGKNLLLIGIISYQAILPNGLSPQWINPPGTLIDGLIVVGTFYLLTPDPNNIFIAGTIQQGQESAGILTHILNGIDGDVHNIAFDGIGYTGNIGCTALVPHNNVYQRANAAIHFISLEGKSVHIIKHTEAGQTNPKSLWYDDVHSPPVIKIPGPIYILVTDIPKWLSGIQYHGSGTIFNIGAVAAIGIFRKAYHPTHVAIISVPGNSINCNPDIIPNVNDEWPFNDDIMLGNNIAQNSGYGTVALYKPDGQTISGNTIAFPRRINTYGIVSTLTDERFLDEDKRLTLILGVWDSEALLEDGNAQVYNGDLRHGADGDYSSHILPAIYERKIQKIISSNGILTFVGINYTDINPYGTGDINILLWLQTEDKYFDLGRVVGDNNGDGSGDSLENSYGSRITGNGGIVNFSFLLHSTGLNNNEYVIIVIFNTISGKTISRITGT